MAVEIGTTMHFVGLGLQALGLVHHANLTVYRF